MSTETKYTLTRKNGREDTVTFTGKRAEILELVQSGKTNDEIVEAGYNKGTTSIVRWQAKKLGLLSTVSTVKDSTVQPSV